MYGLDLLAHGIKQRSVLDASSQLVLDTFINEPRVVAQSTELCRWITQQQEAFDVVAGCLTRVCSRPEVFDIVIWQCSAASTDCCMGFDGKTELRDVT